MLPDHARRQHRREDGVPLEVGDLPVDEALELLLHRLVLAPGGGGVSLRDEPAAVLEQHQPHLQAEGLEDHHVHDEDEREGDEDEYADVGQDEGPGDLVGEGDDEEEREDEEDVLEEGRAGIGVTAQALEVEGLGGGERQSDQAHRKREHLSNRYYCERKNRFFVP